jgi:hypothetical protein
MTTAGISAGTTAGTCHCSRTPSVPAGPPGRLFASAPTRSCGGRRSGPTCSISGPRSATHRTISGSCIAVTAAVARSPSTGWRMRGSSRPPRRWGRKPARCGAGCGRCRRFSFTCIRVLCPRSSTWSAKVSSGGFPSAVSWPAPRRFPLVRRRGLNRNSVSRSHTGTVTASTPSWPTAAGSAMASTSIPPTDTWSCCPRIPRTATGSWRRRSTGSAPSSPGTTPATWPSLPPRSAPAISSRASTPSWGDVRRPSSTMRDVGGHCSATRSVTTGRSGIRSGTSSLSRTGRVSCASGWWRNPARTGARSSGPLISACPWRAWSSSTSMSSSEARAASGGTSQAACRWPPRRHPAPIPVPKPCCPRPEGSTPGAG